MHGQVKRSLSPFDQWIQRAIQPTPKWTSTADQLNCSLHALAEDQDEISIINSMACVLFLLCIHIKWLVKGSSAVHMFYK